jgi:CCR4-NOT transcription complex subunit 7/8
MFFTNAQGEFPKPICTWQLNFKYDIERDLYNQSSIDLLQKSGLDFEKHKKDGIDVVYFAELLTTSGLVLNEDITWVTFHSGINKFFYFFFYCLCRL